MVTPRVEISGPPVGQKHAFNTLLSGPAVSFLAELIKEFQCSVEMLYTERSRKKIELERNSCLPDFSVKTQAVRDSDWEVYPVPDRLRNRHVDLGDVSPSNLNHFKAALRSSAQGIQVDFDDGHCPTWCAQLAGLLNVYLAVHNELPDVPAVAEAPVLMLRPRAWNMIEQNFMVNGREVPGPLFDFGLLMFHNAKLLYKAKSGPFFYLSKVESAEEAQLWNDIFTWTEQKLGLPFACIKATVLIENILAAFEMNEILYALRTHSAGLNCGIWDYSASFVNKFGHRGDFVLPDRNKYVNMDRHFLKSYMALTIKTCHSRGCTATGGMSAAVLPENPSEEDVKFIIDMVSRSKLKEIQAGVDGFMVYDVRLVQPMQMMWSEHTRGPNQLTLLRKDVHVTASDLLQIPSGGVTVEGLGHNIAVGVMFIEAWLRGQGTFILKGVVEDSATAEISRSQVWQWIRFGTALENSGRIITFDLVKGMAQAFIDAESKLLTFQKGADRERLMTACRIFLQIVKMRDFPSFITTYLSNNGSFLTTSQNLPST